MNAFKIANTLGIEYREPEWEYVEAPGDRIIGIKPGEFSSEFVVMSLDLSGPEFEVIARGSVRWDGCANFEAGLDCLVHTCGAVGLAGFLDALGEACRLAFEATEKRDDELNWQPRGSNEKDPE